MKTAFLDTGYVVALEASDDQYHAVVSEHWRQFSSTPPPLLTTTLVLAEIITFFNCRRRHDKAVEIGTRLLESPSVEVIHVDEELWQRGWEYLVRHQDKTYSLTDCVARIAANGWPWAGSVRFFPSLFRRKVEVRRTRFHRH